jgi:hypothetical protein
MRAFSSGAKLMVKRKRRVVRAWSTADVRSLRRLAKARLSGAQTAKELGRTPGAVAQKAMKLGVSFRSKRRARR